MPYGEEPKEALRGVDLADASVTSTASCSAWRRRRKRETMAPSSITWSATARGVAVLLDESSYVERIGGQPGGEARIAERVALWRQFCDYHGTRATLVNLQHP